MTEALRQVVEEDQWGVRSTIIAEFETTFAQSHDAQYALAMMNGTMALIAALKANGVGPGDEVIIPAYTFVASATAILQAGAVPIFADIDKQTFNLDPTDVAHRITSHTRAIMPVHIGGNPADMDAFGQLAKKHSLIVVEDAAQAHGAVYNGLKAGAIGDAGSFSFQSSKNITAGEGGMLLTNSEEVYERAFEVYNCGRTLNGPWYEHVSPGLNMRMSAFQAAILLYQMPFLEEWAVTREANGRYLEEQLNTIPGITCARRYPGTTRNAYHLLIFSYDQSHFDGLSKERFLEALSAEGVVATPGYQPLYRLPFLKQQSANGEFILPVTEDACQNGIWIRQFELLAERPMMDGIADAIRKVQAQAHALHES
ncbi:MAG: DegT/DnrJ/EryC1/StrS family aminotransferase [Fidelibacterota bacterium]|nr:MAG: DegT/DnrJ/EryC1/StrS family aminotransferase [Candidatus Neomarinimicrobiota bacterium]